MNKQNQRDKTDRLRRNKLKLTNIHTDCDNFQFRKHGLDSAHLKELTALVQRGVMLDPITVWLDPEERKCLVLAGHHRLEAYRRAKVATVLPVLVFNGTFDEAQAHALKSNTKNQMPMTTEERQNGAWRLVCQWSELNGYPLSIVQTSKSAGVSTSQISNMRKIRSKLHDEGEVMPRTWWEALGRIPDDVDPADEDERLAAHYAKLDAAIGSDITKAGRMCPAALGKVLACRLGQDYHTVISFAASDVYYEEGGAEYPF